MTNRYFEFLSNIVEGHDYSLLLKQLHRTEFYSLVPNDDNRGEDGKKLREIFFDVEGFTDDIFDLDEAIGVCTVLEMLIGVSYRMVNELDGNGSAKSVSECFWILIENLGLSYFDNSAWLNSADSEYLIPMRIQNFLERKYSKHGYGGLFPLKNASRDQRKVEVWYQMCEYLLENFEF